MMFLKLHKEGNPLRINPDHVEAYLSRPARPGPGTMTGETEVVLRRGATVHVDETPEEVDEILDYCGGNDIRGGAWSLDRVRLEKAASVELRRMGGP
jgi:hypothetical protein